MNEKLARRIAMLDFERVLMKLIRDNPLSQEILRICADADCTVEEQTVSCFLANFGETFVFRVPTVDGREIVAEMSAATGELLLAKLTAAMAELQAYRVARAKVRDHG